MAGVWVAIIGSREYSSYATVDQVIDALPPNTVIVSGGARGVDRRAEDRAHIRGLRVRVFKPDWQRYGLSAGPRRNQQIVQHADRVIAFWSNHSAGTLSTIKIALDLGKPLQVYNDAGMPVSDEELCLMIEDADRRRAGFAPGKATRNPGTTVVNIRRTRRYDVYIGRPSRWGNPFVIGRDGDRATVVEKFRVWVRTSDDARAVWIRENVYRLRGKTLGCFCAPAICHGDVLAEMAESEVDVA